MQKIRLPTPIDFKNKGNGVYESGLPYKLFPDYLDFQNYLEGITRGQEVSLEISVNPDTDTQTNNGIIKWITDKS